MTEAIGEAAMTETPVVIAEAQRGGPSTGLPTKSEQGDLFQMLGASQGEFPKVIIAPRTLKECYDTTIHAFNLAEKYQCPVMIATDLYLAERLETFDGVDINRVPIERGPMVTEANGVYRRFADTPTGVSPRALPGTPGTVYVSATDEHDEDGIVISDVFTNPSVRKKMMDKRMRKVEHILKEIPAPILDGPRDADLTLIGWGSTYQVMLEAMEALNAEGLKVNVLCLNYLWPFPVEPVTQLLGRCKMTMSVEVNYTGQLVKLIRMETGVTIQHHLRKYDGEPFELKQVVDQVRTILKTRPKQSVIATVVSDEGLPPDFSPIENPALGAEVSRQH